MSSDPRPVPGLPAAYAVSAAGQVFKDGAPLPPQPASLAPGQYLRVTVRWADGRPSRFAYVHELVCLAFHGERPSPGHQAIILDGDRDHLAPNNLAWLTPTAARPARAAATEPAAIARAAAHARAVPPTDDNPDGIVLTPEEIAQLRRLIARGFTPEELAGHLLSRSDRATGALLEARRLTPALVRAALEKSS